MNRTILISVGITITIIIFAITQMIAIDENEISYDEGTVEINSVLEKIKQDKIKNDNSDNPYVVKEREWHGNELFFIDRYEYVLGEKIFVNYQNPEIDMKGEMLFAKIINSTTNKVYKKIPFDSSKSQTNFYLGIWPSVPSGFCNKDSLVGEWTVDFVGIDIKDIKFKITDKIIPGLEKNFAAVC